MFNAKYRPHADSLAGRVVGFFALSPEEELTLEDIISKFADKGDSRNIHSQLTASLDAGLLDYDPGSDTYSKGPLDLPSVLDFDPIKRSESKSVSDEEIPQSGFKRWLAKRGEESAEGGRKQATRAAASRARKCKASHSGSAIDSGEKVPFGQQQQAAPFSLVAKKKTMNNKASPLNLSDIKIERGIPLPEPGHEWRAFLAKFEIGDSAALPAQFLMKVRTAMKAQKTAGRGEYTSRTIDADTIRVWRTA